MPRAPKFTPVAATALAPSPRNLFVGTSGWAYPTWKPGFYPSDVPSKGFLHHYAARLTSVEVNYTFRTLPTEEQLRGWLEASPPGFRFSFKVPQTITHFQRLLNSKAAVKEFVTALEPARAMGKLGPLLFQLPPNFAVDLSRLKRFLAMPVFADASLQVAFEFRNPTWFDDAVYEVLQRHNAALCVAESDTLESPDVATADFSCYRLRRSGGYSEKKLKEFARRFGAIAETREVFAYFMHEEEPTGVLNAVAMQRAAVRAGC